MRDGRGNLIPGYSYMQVMRQEPRHLRYLLARVYPVRYYVSSVQLELEVCVVG